MYNTTICPSVRSDTFVMEYCGEVCTPEEFEHRKMEYRIEKRRHYYFMSLHTDEVTLPVCDDVIMMSSLDTRCYSEGQLFTIYKP